MSHRRIPQDCFKSHNPTNYQITINNKNLNIFKTAFDFSIESTTWLSRIKDSENHLLEKSSIPAKRVDFLKQREFIVLYRNFKSQGLISSSLFFVPNMNFWFQEDFLALRFSLVSKNFNARHARYTFCPLEFKGLWRRS